MSAEGKVETLADIISRYPDPKGHLLSILHDVQEAQGYLSQEAMKEIAAYLKMTPPQVYGVITFYSDFRTTPPPPKVIGICNGPACHIRGAERIKKTIQERLGLDKEEEGTAANDDVEVRIVQCNGACDVAPMIYVDGEIYGRVGISDLDEIVRKGEAR